MPAPPSSRGRAGELAPRAPPARRWTGRRRVLGGRERGVRGRARSRRRVGGAENIARVSGEDRVVAHGCVTLHIPAAAAGGPRAAPGPISRSSNGPNRGHTRSSAPSRNPIDRPTPTTEYFGGLAGRAGPPVPEEPVDAPAGPSAGVKANSVLEITEPMAQMPVQAQVSFSMIRRTDEPRKGQ